MIVQQKQNLEAFVRVLAFLEEHPVEGPLTYTGPRETLDDVVRRLREYAGAQVTGRQLSSGELRWQKRMVRQLRDRHIRPMVAIARAQVEPDADVRIPSIRMPKSNLGVTKFLQACDGMIEAARPFEAAFVANGLPADFLARFTAARNELERGLGVRAAHIGMHIGARAGLRVQMQRGRRALDRIDAVVRASFDGDEVTLATWRFAKRAHQLPGGPTARSTDTAEVQQVPLAA
jgi:hypothetical protein